MYFKFLAKNTPKLQKLLKNRPKSSICLIIFYISLKKNPLFDVDLFSQIFDMELPLSVNTINFGQSGKGGVRRAQNSK